ncbi:ATP-grasp domain-containing protein [Streptomyces boluensis]|uniref:ATP-grasp domain-containing protein n=1 Tax=Streptomyces boluensis TaxID=1775135 RepID=A0A964XJ50_9ACTN|nr:ATP-grasp domain-containing protein [Streptomyces boluensis]NBE50755.1 ATP-grasp domain-containing protein [Streptomyces boluensis]
MHGRIVVIGGIVEILRAAHEAGLEVVLVHNPGGAAPGSEKYCTEILEADFKNDYETVQRLVVERHRERPFDRVFSLTENGLVPAARLNALLGLGGNSVESVRLLKDKAAMRRRLAERGAGTAVRHRVVRSCSELVQFWRELDGPVFVKPTDSAGSIGVFRAADLDGIREGWARLRALGRGEALAEEFLEGPEFSVEGFLWEGRHHVVAITNTLLSDGFYELGHSMPAALPPEVTGQIHEVVAELLDAVGLTEGPTHSEVRLTPSGPRIIESHNRMGGERLHELMEMAFGLDVTRLSVTVPLGIEPLPRMTDLGTRGAAIRHILPAPGRVVAISGVEEATAAAPELRIRIGAEVGDSVGAVVDGVTRDRVGCYVLAAGADVAAAEEACAAVLDTVRIDTVRVDSVGVDAVGIDTVGIDAGPGAGVPGPRLSVDGSKSLVPTGSSHG